MKVGKINRSLVFREVRDYVMIAFAMMLYCIGWTLFLLPNNITTGGIPGISSIIYWGTGVPVQVSYFIFNVILILFALWILGWRFCIKTIFAMFTLTTMVAFSTENLGHIHILSDQPFMTAILGALFCGSGVGLSLSFNGSTGGTDIIAAIINKYKNISLGKVIMLADVIIVTSSYLVVPDIEKIVYGYVVLLLTGWCIDAVVSSFRQSVQFFIISDKFEEIGREISAVSSRGCTVINSKGSYTGNDVKMLFVLARRSESSKIFNIIQSVDPKAFVSQSLTIGVYGDGFDKFKK